MPMTEKEFQEAIAEMHLGHVPDSLARITAHTNKTTREYVMFHEALVDCVNRQKNMILVLRELMHRLEKNLKRLQGGSPEKEIDTEKVLSCVYWLGGQAGEALRNGDNETYKDFISCASTMYDLLCLKQKKGEKDECVTQSEP